MTKTRQHVLIWILAGLFTGLSLVAHLTSPSSIHQTDGNWQARIEMHKNNAAFKVRPFTTTFIDLIHNLSGFSYRTSFFLLQFLLMLICGPVLTYYLLILGFPNRLALTGMAAFYFSLPVFMAHFDPVYTWSDFWVYLMIPLSFTLILRRFYLTAALAFTWALLARETSLLFLPIWLLLVYRVERRRLIQPVLWSLVALTLWIAVRLIISGVSAGNLEFKLAFNFDGFLRSRDTVFSLLVSLGVLWPIGLRQIAGKSHAGIVEYELIRFGAVFTACGYVISTLLFAQARETRLFFPPFVFFIPLALVYMQRHEASMRAFLRRWRSWQIICAAIVITGLSIFIAVLLFPDFDFRTWKDGNRIIFGLHLAASITLIVLSYTGSRYPHNETR